MFRLAMVSGKILLKRKSFFLQNLFPLKLSSIKVFFLIVTLPRLEVHHRTAFPFFIIESIVYRVLNVLRHWVDQHFYDFQREETLLSTLQKFLSRVVRSKTARKWVETIEKIVNRRVSQLDFKFNKITRISYLLANYFSSLIYTLF